MGEIEDMKKENKSHLVNLTELRKENIELKQSLHAFKEFCDTTLALKDEEIKKAIIVNNSKIDGKKLLIKEEEIVASNIESEEHKNKYKECKVKFENYVEMSKQGIKVKERDKTTIILNACGEELGCLDWKDNMRIAMKLVNSCDLCYYGHNFREYVETHMEQTHPEKYNMPNTPCQI